MGQVPSANEREEEDTRRYSSEEELPDLLDPESSGHDDTLRLPRAREHNMAEGLYSDEEDDNFGLPLGHPSHYFPSTAFMGLSHLPLANYDFSDSEDDYPYFPHSGEVSDYTLSDESFSDFEGDSAQPSSTAPGGYDFEFVDTPPEDLHCSVCLFVLRDPQLTSCCGHHFCKGCISRVITRGKSCPLCQAEEFTVMLDKNFQRKIYELKIKCVKSAEGCEWVGEVKNLESHTDVGNGDCGYVEVDCKYQCGAKVQRREMEEHIDTTCSQRPFVCRHCGHKSSYAGVTEVHYNACKKYPVKCPNECSIDPIPREALQQHTDWECPLQLISCEFSFVGCHLSIPRKDMAKHISEGSNDHLRMVARDFQLKLDEKDKRIASLERTLEEQKSKISTIQQELNQQKQLIQRQESKPAQTITPTKQSQANPATNRLPSKVYSSPPVDFVMPDFPALKSSNRQWFSEPFYSSKEGYKMCLSVFANGIGIGRGTHISLFANMMRGEFDDNLSWPFRGSVFVQVRLDNRKEYYEVNLVFNPRSPQRACARVASSDKSPNPFGQGSVRFLSHAKVQPLPATLQLRVCRVNVF